MRIPRSPGLVRSPLHGLVLDLLEEGIRAADPRSKVSNTLARQGSCVIVAGRSYCPRSGVYVLGFGKAARGMAEGVLESLGDLVRAGLVIAPRGHGGQLGPINVLEGDHPISGPRTLESSRRLIEFSEKIPRDALAIVLVSGGGSALFELPANGLSLEDIASTTSLLLKAGASIEELNAVRKHLSAVKGGQLLRYIGAERVETLIISDVVGDRLDTIASGPTVPDETTFHDAVNALKKYGLWEKVPERVREWLEKGLRGEVDETPKPGDKIFEKSRVTIVASNITSLRAMEKLARERGWRTLILSSRIRGEAREVAAVIAGIIEGIVYENTPVQPPIVLLAGGETTVTVKGKGIGGRNQELCLALAIELRRLEADYVAACMGSDGVDGVSPAAGAIIDSTLMREAYSKGLDPIAFLEDNDSYTFFKKLDRCIETGYTGTNVNDFIVVVIPQGAGR
ncbi:MAG: glycerate kinase [Pyrodictiaceae archaeon]